MTTDLGRKARNKKGRIKGHMKGKKTQSSAREEPSLERVQAKLRAQGQPT
jgi:hypothetical protein